MLLPIRIVYPTLVLAAPFLVVAAAVDGRWTELTHAVVGGVVAFLAFCVIRFVYPAGMAFGDLRLAGIIGVFLGWLGYGVLFFGFFAAFLSASVIGIGLIVARRATRKTAVPFGVFLALGAVFAVLWGQPIVDAWLQRG